MLMQQNRDKLALWKQIVFYSVFFVIATILTLFLLEVILRNTIALSIAWPQFYSNLMGDMEPNMKVVDTVQREYPFKVTTNSEGMRSLREFDRKKPLNTIRILCLGDSFTYGWGVDDEYTYPEYLYQMLKRQYPDLNFEVLNTGVPYYNIFDEIDYYEEKGHKLNADIVIVQFYNNDIHDMSKDHFFRTGSRLNANRKYTEGFNLRKIITTTAIYSTIIKLKSFLNKPVMSFPPEIMLILKTSKYYQFLIPSPSKEESDIIGNREKINDERLASDLNRFWKNYKKGLLELKRMAEADGSQFLFIAMPDHFQMETYRSAHSSVLISLAQKHGIKMIDFLKPFRKAIYKYRLNPYIFPERYHSSKDGNKIIAREIADRLKIFKDSSGSVNVEITDNEGLFNCDAPIHFLLDINEVGIIPLHQDSFVSVSTIERTENVKFVIENDIRHLRVDSVKNEIGRYILRAATKKPVRHLAIITFKRINHDKEGNSRVQFSFSSDGNVFQELYDYRSQKTSQWDSMENIDISELAFKENFPASFYLKFEMTKQAGILTEKAINKEPYRRFELILCPAL